MAQNIEDFQKIPRNNRPKVLCAPRKSNRSLDFAQVSLRKVNYIDD